MVRHRKSGLLDAAMVLQELGGVLVQEDSVEAGGGTTT
jgi:hypothetical protein